MASDTRATTSAPGWMAFSMWPSADRVVSPPGSTKVMLPSGSGSKPTACGSCFRMIVRPMPVSIPLMTEDGK